MPISKVAVTVNAKGNTGSGSDSSEWSGATAPVGEEGGVSLEYKTGRKTAIIISI